VDTKRSGGHDLAVSVAAFDTGLAMDEDPIFGHNAHFDATAG